MNNNQFINILIILLLALTINSFSVRAQDALVQGSAILDLEQCTPITTSFSITNPTAATLTYSISADGDAAHWTAYAPLQFTVLPNQQQQIIQVIAPPCSTLGTHKLLTTLTSSQEEETVLEQTISITKPINIDLTVPSEVISADPCTSTDTNVTVHNLGQFTETYTLSITGIPARITPTTLTIPPRQNGTVLLNTNPRDCNTNGTYPFTVSAKTSTTKLNAVIDLQLLVLSRGIASIAPAIKTIRTGPEPSTSSISITNLGNETTTYTLTLSAPSWVTLTSPNVTIPPNTVSPTYLTFAPDNKTLESTYQLTLTAQPRGQPAIYSKQITLTYAKPSKIWQTFKTHWFAISIFIIAVVVLFYVARSINNYVTSKEVASEQQEKEQEDQLHKRITQELKKKYLFVPKTTDAKELPTSRKDLWITLLILCLMFSAFAAYKFRVFVLSHLYSVLLGITIAVVLLAIMLVIKKVKSHRRITWRALVAEPETSVNIPGWKQGLTNIAFDVEQRVLTPSVEIQREETSSLALNNAVPFAAYKITAPSQFKNARIAISIPQHWITKHNIRESSIRVYVHDRTGKSISSSAVTNTQSEFNFTATIPSVEQQGVHITILGISKEKSTVEVKETKIQPSFEKKSSRKSKRLAEQKHSKILQTTLALLLVIGLIIGTYILASPKNPVVPTQGIPPQVWFMNTNKAIDLTTYFKDPDRDKLIYNSSIAEHVNVTIRNGTAYVTPEKNWIGTSSITFTATDTKGATATSNLVTLQVQKPVVPSILRQYLIPILFGITLLVVIITILEVLRARKEE